MHLSVRLPKLVTDDADGLNAAEALGVVQPIWRAHVNRHTLRI